MRPSRHWALYYFFLFSSSTPWSWTVSIISTDNERILTRYYSAGLERKKEKVPIFYFLLYFFIFWLRLSFFSWGRTDPFILPSLLLVLFNWLHAIRRLQFGSKQKRIVGFNNRTDHLHDSILLVTQSSPPSLISPVPCLPTDIPMPNDTRPLFFFYSTSDKEMEIKYGVTTLFLNIWTHYSPNGSPPYSWTDASLF